MHEQAVLRPGRDFDPLRAGLYYSHRLVTRPRLRRVVQQAIALGVTARHGRPALPAAPAAALGTLRQDGLIDLPGLVPPERAQAFADYFASREVAGAGGPHPLAAVPGGTAVAGYPLETVLACPGLVELVNDPRVLALAAGYLGCWPTLSSLRVRWSLPGPGRRHDTQWLHRDYDDWLSLKLFVYLTDVDAGAGPHLFVRGTHREAGTLFSRQVAPEAAAARHAGRLRRVEGQAGTSFLADVFGLHCGLVPETAPRLMLQVQYSLLPVYALRYRPVPRDLPAGANRYVNRLMVAAPAEQPAWAAPARRRAA